MSSLATFACNPERTKGRIFSENYHDYRNNFQRDRDRIIHSNSFRRLEYKTQVFVNDHGDHYRTRLTHSLEVASVARQIARALKISEDLSESIALAHDIGHPPFGHAGEDALKKCMIDYQGFCHNAHAVKLLTKLEQRYFEFDGLNLCWETIEGVAKHNGPIANPPEAIFEYNLVNDLELTKYSSAEAQVAAVADDISYHSHDLEDGIRAGFFLIDDLKSIDLLSEIIISLEKKYGKNDPDRLVYETVRELSHLVIADLLFNTEKELEKNSVKLESDIRNAGKKIVSLSDSMELENKKIKDFLYKNMYNHESMSNQRNEAKNIIKSLFEFYVEFPEKLPYKWLNNYQNLPNQQKKYRLVCDYIAGMTDRYAYNLYSSELKL